MLNLISSTFYIDTKTILYHLFTEENSVFCGPETAVVTRGEAESNNGGRACSEHDALWTGT
jgi:hypothetical protein